jgi:hypothetical protein
MCPDCGRPKMLFETEAKAKNFIKFNSDNIDCNEELRPYYCPACCGYHISSKKFKKAYEKQTEKLLKAFRQSTELTPLKEFALIDELFNIMLTFNVASKKAVNKLLRGEEFDKYNDKVKEQARIKYYKFVKLHK